MADSDRPSSRAGTVIGLVVTVLVVLGLGLWFLTRDRNADVDIVSLNLPSDTTLTDGADSSDSIRPAVSNAKRGLGSGGAVGEAAMFEGRDIHDVPLGTILDYAQTLTYDEARGHELRLSRNQKGQAPRVKIMPYAGASSLEAATLKQGRIVARIESDGAYDELGLADGLNYLWVESRPGGGYRGVVIPATAFAPLHDLDRVAITERTPSGVPLEKGAYWANGGLWIACGRC